MLNKIYDFSEKCSHFQSTSSTQNATSIENLPNDVLKEIFLYVIPNSTLFNLKLVCKQWNTLCKDKTIWKIMFKKLQQQTKFQSFVAEERARENLSEYYSIPMEKKCFLLHLFTELTKYSYIYKFDKNEKESSAINSCLQFLTDQGATRDIFLVYLKNKDEECKSFFVIYRYAHTTLSNFFNGYAKPEKVYNVFKRYNYVNLVEDYLPLLSEYALNKLSKDREQWKIEHS